MESEKLQDDVGGSIGHASCSWFWSADSQQKPWFVARGGPGWSVDSCSRRMYQRKGEREGESERGGRSAARLWQSSAETRQSNRSGQREVRWGMSRGGWCPSFLPGLEAYAASLAGPGADVAELDSGIWTSGRFNPSGINKEPLLRRHLILPTSIRELWAARPVWSCSCARWAGPTADTCAQDGTRCLWMLPHPPWKVTRLPTHLWPSL